MQHLKMTPCLILCALFVSTFISSNAQTVTKIGSFKISNPAFLNLYVNENVTNPLDKFDLLISTFGASPFSTDTISVVKGVGQFIKTVDQIIPEIITTKTTWPNEVSGVPENVFGRRFVAIPDGFILPFKTDGALKLMDVSQFPALGPYPLTDDSTGQWFYHRVEWRDMDGDGDQDAVTCRAREPIIVGSKASELLWLENPNGELTSPWKPHVLVQGPPAPDIFFQVLTLNTTDGPFNCIVTSQFFSQALVIYWTVDPKGHWTDPTMVKYRIIDKTIGDVFDVKVDDVNNDGKLDFLVTNNGFNGSVFVYEIPADFRTGSYARHVLSTGYVPLHQGKGQGSPGSSFPIQLSADKKPVILLSGDDNGCAYLLTPSSNDVTDWSYTQTKFLDTGSLTVGQPAFGDVDGDGINEIFVPSYSTSEVFVYELNTMDTFY